MERLETILKNKQRAHGQATAHQQLAAEIAESFDDVAHIGVYMRICKRHNLNIVRKIWKEVFEMRPSNPGAYFTSVVHKEARIKKQELRMGKYF